MMLTATQTDTLSRLRGQFVNAHGRQPPAPGAGGLKARDVAQDLRVSRQAAVAALAELISRGLVVRHVSPFKGGPATYSAVDAAAAFPALARMLGTVRFAAALEKMLDTWRAEEAARGAHAFRHQMHIAAAAGPDEPSPIRIGETRAEIRHRDAVRRWWA